MRYLISPKHFSDDFTSGWTLEDKIDVFEARIQGWQLGIAKSLASENLQDAQLAILHLVSTYFEMIGKYIKGYLGDDKSKMHFEIGFRHVFPDIEETESAFMDSVYRNLRCGLYHLGRPAPNVILNDDAQGSIGYHEQHDMIMVSPTKFLSEVEQNFEAYVRGLRNPSNPKLRRRFEARFDHDNRLNI
jgi:hypothetical protein